MIQITRALARQLRAVLRKAAPLGSGRNDRPSLSLHAGPDGMQIRCHRRMIWETVRSSASSFVDGRMSAEVLRVLAVNEPAVDDYYQQTLFAPEEAYAGACTTRSTIYTASIAAGWMVHQFAKWLRRLPVDADLVLNLLAAELTVGGAS